MQWIGPTLKPLLLAIWILIDALGLFFKERVPGHGRQAWVLLVSLLLIGCRPGVAALPTTTPIPTPQVVRVALPPAAKPAEGALYACEQAMPALALVLEEVPDPDVDLSQFDLTLRLFEPAQADIFLAPIASERIVIIAQKDIPVASLTREELERLFGGDVPTWGEFFGPQASFNTPVILFGFASSDPLRQIVEGSILGPAGSISPGIFLAPDPEAMLEAVAETPGALGYLPEAWLSKQVTEIPVPESLVEAFSLTLLAAAANPPSRAVEDLIRCLQSPTGQAALADYYSPFDE